MADSITQHHLDGIAAVLGNTIYIIEEMASTLLSGKGTTWADEGNFKIHYSFAWTGPKDKPILTFSIECCFKEPWAQRYGVDTIAMSSSLTTSRHPVLVFRENEIVNTGTYAGLKLFLDKPLPEEVDS